MVKESISKLDRFAAANRTEPVWIGIDVHKRSYHVALRSESGRSETFVCSGEAKVLLDQLIRLGPRVALVV